MPAYQDFVRVWEPVSAESGAEIPTVSVDRRYVDAIKALVNEPRLSVAVTGGDPRARVEFCQKLAVSHPVVPWQGNRPRLRFFELLWPKLLARQENPAGGLHALRELLLQDPATILFVEDLRPLLSPTADAEPIVIAAKALGGAIQSGAIACVGAIDPAWYEPMISANPRWAARFVAIQLSTVDDSKTLAAVVHEYAALEQQHGVQVAPESLCMAYVSTREHQPDREQPKATLALLEAACERYRHKRRIAKSMPDVADDQSMRYLSDKVQPYDIARTFLELADVDVQTIASEWGARFHGFLANHAKAAAPHAMRLTKLAANLRLGIRAPFHPAAIVPIAGPNAESKRKLAKVLHRVFTRHGDLATIDLAASAPEEAVGQLRELRLRAPRRYTVVRCTGVARARPDVCATFAGVLLESKTGANGRVLSPFHDFVILIDLDTTAAAGVSVEQLDAAIRDRFGQSVFQVAQRPFVLTE